MENRVPSPIATGAQFKKRGPTTVGLSLLSTVSPPFSARPLYPSVDRVLTTDPSAKAPENVPGPSQLTQPQNVPTSPTSRNPILPAIANDDPGTITSLKDSMPGSAPQSSIQAVFSSDVNPFTSSPRAMGPRDLESSTPSSLAPRKPIGMGVGFSDTAVEHHSSTSDNVPLPSPQRSEPRRRSTYTNTEFPHSDTILTYRTVRSGRAFSGRLGDVPVDIEENSNREVRDQGLGGFPGPISLSTKLLRSIIPQSTRSNIERKFTVPVEERFVAKDRVASGAGFLVRMRAVRWLKSTTLTVGRNSRFYTDVLSDDEVSRLSIWPFLFWPLTPLSKLEEIGGIEYRALRVLGYLVFTVSTRHRPHLSPISEYHFYHLVLYRDTIYFLHSFRSLYVHKVQGCFRSATKICKSMVVRASEVQVKRRDS